MQLILRRRARDERGATLVFMAFLLIALLGMAGLVVDLGLVRSNRQRNKSVADVAVGAGVLASNLGGGAIGPFKAACAARSYIQANHAELGSFSTEQWTDGDGTDLALTDPCSAPPATACDTSSASDARDSFAWFHGETDTISVDIKAGYAASDMTGFGDETYHDDTGDPAQFGCDQLAVIIQERETAGFGKVVGAGTLSSTIRSVGRANIQSLEQVVIALLLLEREDCNVMAFNGTNARVLVKGNGDRPGLIHADSIGNGDNCNSQILNGVVSSPPGDVSGPAIQARQAETGSAKGQITVSALYPGYAGADSSKAATACPQTVYAEPTGCVGGATRKGRSPVDNLFYDREVALRQLAVTQTNWSAATAAAAPNNYTVVDCGASGVISAQKVFVNCPGSFNNAVDFSADDAQIIFNGSISVGNTMVFRNPRSIFVKGPSSNGAAVSVGGNGVLSINAGSATPPSTCTSRFPTYRARTTKFVMVNGSFSVNGNNSSVTRMCGTSVLMGAGPSPTAAFPGKGAAPYDNAYNGSLSLGGNGSFDWTAPNATETPMSASDASLTSYLNNFEDLAFWTEAANNNSLAGGGSNIVQGIFFLPNANPFTISGGASQAIDRDAQFIVRKLTMGGNGVLSMRPNPNNAISFPSFGGFDLVR